MCILSNISFIVGFYVQMIHMYYHYQYYKIVVLVLFVILSNVLKNYDCDCCVLDFVDILSSLFGVDDDGCCLFVSTNSLLSTIFACSIITFGFFTMEWICFFTTTTYHWLRHYFTIYINTNKFIFKIICLCKKYFMFLNIL